MAMRGVGNMASGAPTKLRRHRAAVMEVLCRGLEDAASTEVAAECLLALTKVLGRLKTRAMGLALEDISRSTRAFLGAACKVALHQCAPFLGSKRVQQRIAAGAGLSVAELQDKVCGHLAQDCPALLETLCSTARSCCMGSYQAPQAEAITVLGILLDMAPAERLQRWDLAFLWGAFANLVKSL
ncbi:protein maestro-like [Struthio camelus]|uniref:protein maestro-like n=1 Tax=Struthio camelus TaxID=8801 RepID=UPI003603E46A